MTIAVTGATGQLGRIVVQKLKEKVGPTQIVALARSAIAVSSGVCVGATVGVTGASIIDSQADRLSARMTTPFHHQ